MRREAKASSAGSTKRWAIGLGGIRGAFATRGGLGRANGSGAPSHRATRFAIAILNVALAALAFAPTAGAVLTRSLAQTVGADGNSPGTAFTNTATQLMPLAFNQTTKRLYAVDTAALKLYGYDTTTPGTYAPLASPFPLTLASKPTFPDVEVDNTALASAGRIYYTLSNGLAAYDPSGTQLNSGNGFPGFPIVAPTPIPINPAGIAVDSLGNVFLGDTQNNAANNKVFRYNSSGASLGTISTSSLGNGRPRDLTLDSNGDLYVALANTKPSGVYRLAAADGYDQSKATLVEAADGTAAPFPFAIALDTSAHVLYVVHQTSVSAYDAPTGTFLYSFGGAVVGAKYGGIAVDQSTNKVYLGDVGNKKIQVFNPSAPAPNATGTVQAATNVAATTVTLNATINDNSELPTKWRFQTSKDGVTWINAGTGGTTAGNGVGTAVSANVTGLTHNTDYHFRIVTNKGSNPADDVPSTDLTFHTLTIPNASVILQAATGITGTGATLNATLTDNGPLPTSWRFEISPNGTSWSTVPGGSGITAGNQTSVPLSAAVSGLLPNSTYKFRLVASKGAGSDGDIPTGALSFKTLATAPLVSGLTAINVSDTSALLVGQVDPRGSETGYVFEYGTTPALGNATEPVGIGSAQGFQLFTLPLSGLKPHTTYYYRLVATNVAGSTASVFKTLTTRTDPLPLPDDRSYEQVSPVDKNGGGAQSGTFAGTTPAYDGGAIGFCTSSLFGEPAPEMTSYGYACGDYVSHRGALGWTTRAVAPPVCGAGKLSLSRLSLNLEAATFTQPESASCALSPLTPAAPMPSTNLYRTGLVSGSPGYELLNPVAAGGSGPFYSGSSDDFSHIVYTDTSQQTGDAPAGGFAKIYDWDNGTLSLISKSTAGAPFTTDSSVAGGGNANQGPADPDHGVSAGGDRIFFQNPSTSSSGCIATNCELYLRQDGADTYWASQQECSPACSDTTAADTFRYATPDGSKAFFTTAAKLTNDDTSSSGSDLYMYTQPVDPIANPPATDPHNLTLLSQDNEPADGTSASVLGVSGASDDGNTVFFAASGQLVLGQPTAVGPKLYRWHYDAQTATATLDYLATLASGDAANWQSGIGSTRNVTPDGQYLLVRTAGALDPVADSDNTKDFYRWDQKGGWTCISCQGPGVASSGDAIGASASENNLTQINARRRILMSDDGQRIFFTTTDALLPADTNATGGCPNLYAASPVIAPVLACLDTYEWHDGTVSLISTGTSPNPSYLLGVSHDGTDVFFYTTDPLVGWDGDTTGDIYDARIGGGFPEPPPTGAPCDVNAGACEGAGSTPPPNTGAGSAVFQGPGNSPTTQPKPKPHKKHKHAKKAKKHAKRHHERAANTTRRAGR